MTTVDAAVDGARLTQAAYARARDVSRQRVNVLVKDGRIPLDDAGLVIVEAADANLAAMLDRSRANRLQQIAEAQPAPAAARIPLATASPEPRGTAGTLQLGGVEEPAASSGGASPGGVRPRQDANGAEAYWESKTKRETAEAELAQLRLREKLGELVSVEGVRRSRRETALRTATALSQLPAKMAPVVAPQDPLRAQRALAEEVERILLELASDLDEISAAAGVLIASA